MHFLFTFRKAELCLNGKLKINVFVFLITLILMYLLSYFFSLRKLGELNAYVQTSASMEPLTEELISQHSVVVLTTCSLDEQLRVAEITRKHNIALIIAGTPGLFAQIFTDFGTKFKCFDTNGEQPISTMVASVTQEEEGVVAALDEVQL